MRTTPTGCLKATNVKVSEQRWPQQIVEANNLLTQGAASKNVKAKARKMNSASSGSDSRRGSLGMDDSDSEPSEGGGDYDHSERLGAFGG